MKNNTLSYNQKSNNIALERLNPVRSHSRYIHLKLLRKNVERLIGKHLKNRDNLILADMGCGEMPYESLIKPYVNKYIGVDLPGNLKATTHIDLKTNRCDLEDDSCDIVWSVQVLEHVMDPSIYLKECCRILKPEGKLLLSTHGHWKYHADPIDNWRWTSSGLKLEIENAGFSVIETIGMMGLLSTSLQLFQDAVLLSIPYQRLWGNPFCFIMQCFIQLSEWYISKSKTLTAHVNKDACVYFVVATKTR